MAATVKEGAGGNRGGTRGDSEVYGGEEGSYTGSVSFPLQKWRKVFLIWVAAAGVAISAQEPAKEPAKAESKPQEVKPSEPKPQNEKPAAKSEEKPTLQFEIELLETRVQFEASGDSRKEVHTVVKINDASGARQFARLGFDYNRAFQSVEIPLVKISHANGGTSETLPSAIADVANPAVEKFPVYQDVRVKTVRILGLQEGDTLEYRVITTTTKPPLAPDFWVEHSFDRSGIVLHEVYVIDVPGARTQTRVNPETPASVERSSGRETYRWDVQPGTLKPRKADENPSDIVLTSFASWGQLARELSKIVYTGFSTTIYTDAAFLNPRDAPNTPETLYRDVSVNVRTVDLPFEIGTNPVRGPGQILEAKCGTARDKARLLDVLLTQTKAKSVVVAYSDAIDLESELPSPSQLKGLLLKVDIGTKEYFLDPGLDVAPFGALPAKLRGRKVLVIGGTEAGRFVVVPQELPFDSTQKVNVQASIAADGKLGAKVKYVMRGDNELLLREAFHQAPRERWNEVAGLLALSDGFRGHIESVKASDPVETEKPFEVEYEITQPKFVDWAKKPVRIPALLPQIALPDAPGKAGGTIELGTPLEVETEMTLKLPEETTVQTPPGTAVSRDYATYASKYGGHLNTVTASRHVHFLLREIPGDRATDYRAFTRAVKLDETQAIGLFVPEQAEKK